VGHSAGVAQLASAAAQQCGFPAAEVTAIRRAALLHDVGRVGISARIWQKAAALTPGEWEQVRLHAYHTERVLSRSPFLARLAPIATFHHERLDDTGYHRGVAAPSLSPAACLLAVADAYQTKTEPRPHREALSPAQAADLLGREARAGRLDANCVAAVLEAAGQHPPRLPRPAGLTEREAEVVGLLARGLQTKQIARALGISVISRMPKTVLCKPCSNGSPMPRSVAKHRAPITAAVRTSSRITGDSGDTKRRYPDVPAGEGSRLTGPGSWHCRPHEPDGRRVKDLLLLRPRSAARQRRGYAAR
jgi:HD domain/Bacterial regulatory proteins, luxR family